MKFVLLVKSNPATEAELEGPEGLGEAMNQYNAALAQAGALVDAVGLAASKDGARLTRVGDAMEVTKGPFPNPGTIVAGYTVIEAADLDAAIEWARRMPAIALPSDPFEVEVRPLY